MDQSKNLYSNSHEIAFAAVCFAFPSSMKSFSNSSGIPSCQLQKQLSNNIGIVWDLGALKSIFTVGHPLYLLTMMDVLTLVFCCYCLQGPGARSSLQCAETERTMFGDSGIRISHPVRVPRHQAAVSGQYSVIGGSSV